MFNAITIELARQAATDLGDSALIVIPDGDSPLHTPLSLVNTGTMQAMLDPSAVEQVIASLEALNPVMDDLALGWADSIQTTVQTINQLVVPKYVQLVEELDDSIAQVKANPPSSADECRLEVIDVPNWYLDNSRWFTPKTYTTIPSFNGLRSPIPDPRQNNSIMNAVCRTIGSEKDIANHRYSYILRHNFLPATGAAFRADKDSRFLLGLFNKQQPFNRINDAVALSVLAGAVLKMPQDAEMLDSSEEYLTYLNNLVRLANYVINTTLPIIRMYESSQVLIISSSMRDQQIQVISTVYENYLTEGGTSDALLGVLVSGKNVTEKKEVLANQANFINQWIQFRAEQLANNNKIFITAMKRIMRQKVDALGADSFEAKTYGLEEEDRLPSGIKERMFKVIDDFSLNDFNNLEVCAAKLLGQGRYSDTKVYEFLMDIVNISNAAMSMPRADMKELVLNYAIKNMLIRYLTTLLKLSDIQAI